MRCTFFVLLLAASMITSSNSFAQNRFLGDGMSGGSLSVGLYSGEDYSGFGAGMIFTINGQVDLGIGVSRASYDRKKFGRNFSGTAISPSINIAVVRPTELSLIGFDLGAGYSTVSYSGDALDLLGWDMSGYSYGFGGDLYLSVRSSPSLELFPGISAYYTSAYAKIEDRFGGSVEDDVSNIMFSVYLNFLLNQQYHISPMFSTFDGDSQWSISFGFVFPM